MNSDRYQKILKENVHDLKLKHNWVMHQDTDLRVPSPLRCSKEAKLRFWSDLQVDQNSFTLTRKTDGVVAAKGGTTS